MLHGEDKIREMARSILPSTSRWAPWARPRIHRAQRRRENAAVRAMVNDPALWDEGEDDCEPMQREIGPMVRSRRGRDKLNHFERWAVQRTREMPAGDKLGHLAGVLPPGLIGAHAYTHLERLDALTPAGHEHVWRHRRYRRPGTGLLDRGEAAELLRHLLTLPSGHRLFNLALKRARLEVPAHVRLTRRPRLLHGVHDVLPFLADVSFERDNATRLVTDRFLRAFKAARSPVAALLAVAVVKLSSDEYWKLLYGQR